MTVLLKANGLVKTFRADGVERPVLRGVSLDVDQGIVAAVAGVLGGLWVFRWLSDVVSTSIGVGPGWMPEPGGSAVLGLVVFAVVVAAGLGALAIARIARRPASDLIRGE